MNEKQIQEALMAMEIDLAEHAQNLADWFKDRDIPDNHTGGSIVEKMYVSKFLKNITESYARIEQLTLDLAEYRKDLF